MPFEVLALDPIRTICEKIMSLVRFSYSKKPIEDLKNKIRHVYDLHQLLSKDEFMAFFDSEDFEEMLLRVASDDLVSFKNSNKWLIHHPSDAIIFKELGKVWIALKTSYESEFRNLVYGDLPTELELFNTLEKIKERLLSITWTIQS